MTIVISHFQITPLLKAHSDRPGSAAVSPDLGLSTVQATLDADGITFPSGDCISWSETEEIAASTNSCFLVNSEGVRKIQLFSEETNRLYTLYPTAGAPTMLISGIPMHRIKGTDPHRDTLAKVRTVAPVVGRVLDTATGLGYTAIEAARTADEVVTIELDPAASEIARLNPWSGMLFNRDNIRRIIGDSFDEIEKLEDGSFSRVIHDPPMFNLAGDLYSLAFYSECYRVLAVRGKMFHYIGDLESKSGRNVVRGVLERLKRAGFRRVQKRVEAFGVVAEK